MKATIKDDDGKDYVVSDILAFQKHLKEFHFSPGTIHVEDGHRFTVTDEFREMVDEKAKSAVD